MTVSGPDLPTYAIWAMIAVAAVAWIGLSLYALWRAGRMTDRVHSLQDLAGFLDSMIRADRRHPIWLWPDGRLQADAGTFALMGLPEKANHLDDLTSGIGSIPAHLVAALKKDLEVGREVDTPYVIHQGRDKPRLIIDVQSLPSVDRRWPSSVLWVEETVDRPMRTA
jgi:hypothetical protein